MDRLAIDANGVLRNDSTPRLFGSEEAIESLSKKYDIYIVTCCGRKKEDFIRKDLITHFKQYIPEKKWIFTRKMEDKVKVMVKYRISSLIDKSRESVERARSLGLNGIQFNNRWVDVISELKKNKNTTDSDISLDLTNFPPLS